MQSVVKDAAQIAADGVIFYASSLSKTEKGEHSSHRPKFCSFPHPLHLNACIVVFLRRFTVPFQGFLTPYWLVRDPGRVRLACAHSPWRHGWPSWGRVGSEGSSSEHHVVHHFRCLSTRCVRVSADFSVMFSTCLFPQSNIFRPMTGSKTIQNTGIDSSGAWYRTPVNSSAPFYMPITYLSAFGDAFGYTSIFEGIDMFHEP